LGLVGLGGWRMEDRTRGWEVEEEEEDEDEEKGKIILFLQC
jgi:hypothetical protein